jgi:hypothetical protein
MAQTWETPTLSVDYLIIGAGAMGLAFADTMLSDSSATLAIVDRYGRPGGHWTIAYPYVRLHQPSDFYGVNSRRLGEGQIDRVGWNKGLYELATADEICGYYSKVMNQTLLASGRVTYYPKHEYLGDGTFQSLITGQRIQVTKVTRIVDATYMKVKVPAMAPPLYQVADGVTLIPPNNLPQVTRPYKEYVVVGAGKTGIDACLWLLTQGVNPDSIRWIMPRDSWYIERGALQPGPEFEAKNTGTIMATNTSVMAATSLADLFQRLESHVLLTRLDPKVTPTMFRCASVSLAELDQLRRLTKIVRQGRVVRLAVDLVTLEQGSYVPAPDTLYVDCTADALARLKPVPVFQGKQITLQSVRYCQQVFSAAFIAHVEATYVHNDDGEENTKKKNDLCHVVPHPDTAADYLSVTMSSHRNGLRWAAEPKTAAWLAGARLDWFGTLMPKAPGDLDAAREFYAAIAQQTAASCDKLEFLMDQAQTSNEVATDDDLKPEETVPAELVAAH